MSAELIEALKAGFISAGDPERAAGQQAYMKSTMPYHGITYPEIRSICRAVFREHPPQSSQDWKDTVLQVWRGATHREQRYAALELLGHKPCRAYWGPELIDVLEEVIVTGAWWDYVDQVAINMVGPLLSSYPDRITPILRQWSVEESVWLRRSAILAQLKFKERTDSALLFEFMEPSLEEKEFFLRKAIGWALREYSRTESDLVIDYIAVNRDRLSGLSRREGLRNLKKRGLIAADDVRFQAG